MDLTNYNTDLNSNLLDDDFSNMSAKKQARKEKRIEKLKSRGKLNKAQRKADRLKRKLVRQHKDTSGVQLTADELHDKELDIEEAKNDGDTTSYANPVPIPSARPNADDTTIDTKIPDTTTDDTILGMPKNLAIGIGITLSLAVIGFVGYKIVKAKKG